VPSRPPLRLAAAAVLLPLAGAGAHAALAPAAPHGQPAAATRTVLAQVEDPRGARGRTLALSRVRIPAHTALAFHRHPGHQIAYIQRGTLTYRVRSGLVRIYRGAGDAEPALVRTVGPGETGRVRTGEWVVERPGDVHLGANRGDQPVSILLATLFKTGRPASIPAR
jgi:quercetin dioxygenase-like cupin family protein